MYQYPYGNAQQLNLDWILSKIQELESGSGGADLETISNALLSASYSNTITYHTNDIVFYDGKLYRANTDIATPEAWDSSHWDEIMLGDTVSNIVKMLSHLNTYHVENESNVQGDTATDALNNLNGAINDEANIRALLTASNLLNNQATTSTIDGVTFTVNSDKTVTLNGTSTGWTGLLLNTFTLDAGDYILKSGITEHPLNYDCYLEIKNGNTTITNTASRYESQFTIETPTTVTVRVHARPNITFSNSKIYPEIKHKGDIANYAPYEPTNSELNGAINPIRQYGVITKLVDTGTLDSTTCDKYGHICFVSGRIHSMVDNTGEQKGYFLLPEGFRPTSQIRCNGYIRVESLGLWVPIMITLQENGVISAGYSASQTISQVAFSGTFYIE